MNEKINYLKESGTVFLSPSNARALELANAAFQQMKASVMPVPLMNFYLGYGGAILGDAAVFPVEDIDRPGRQYVIPGIVGINRDFAGFAILRGKTVWGRNQLYIFSADIAGNMYMHDVLTLVVLRKYGDFETAILDCLLVGKI